ncbi:unnamed protein product [Mytilus coruscus]|uniref:B box-type domain-containing protein n=1 Tax=Mytilus coruscus TaxID=42192 RepID=A0A6J8ESH1_MYTCO|nr:unnamed protein product [Mytilus coruscus]
MAGKITHCDICSLRDIFKPATVCNWCSECDESICSECQEHHCLSKATSGHPTLPIEDFLKLPVFVRAINIICNEHKEKFDWYCTTHAAPCCLKSLKVNHENCFDIKPIREKEQNIKSSSAFSDIESRCTHLRDVYKTMEDKKYRENKRTTQFELQFVPSNNLNTILDFGRIDALSKPLNIRFDETNQVQIPTIVPAVIDTDNIYLKKRDRGKAIEVLDFLSNDTYLVRDDKQLYQF